MWGDAEALTWPEPHATAGSALPSAVPDARKAGARAARRTRLEPALRGHPHRNRGRGGATARDRFGEPFARCPRQRRARFWRTAQAIARTVARQSHSVSALLLPLRDDGPPNLHTPVTSIRRPPRCPSGRINAESTAAAAGFESNPMPGCGCAPSPVDSRSRGRQIAANCRPHQSPAPSGKAADRRRCRDRASN